MKNSSGFTLLEVLIVTILLFFLAMTTFSAVRGTIDAKEEIDHRTEFLQESRAALSIIDRDLRSAFYLVPNDLGWAPLKPDPNANPPRPPAVFPPQIYIFKGKANEVFFSARSHQRMATDSPENEHHFVTYQLDRDQLIRAESLRAVNLKDREDAKSFRQFVLMKNLIQLKFDYYSLKKEDWKDSWDSESEEDKDQVPAAVRVLIEYKPEVPERSKIKPDPIKISTVIKLTESSFKSPDRYKEAAKNPAASSGDSGNEQTQEGSGAASGQSSGRNQGGST